MEADYIVALIMVAGGIIVALINGLFAILTKRPDSITPRTNGASHSKRSKWIWVSIIVVTMVGLALLLFYNLKSEPSLDPLYEATFTVSATNDWQLSRTVTKGARVEVVALYGQWSPRVDSSGSPIWINADGTGKKTYYSEIGLIASSGSLIAKIGDGSPFAVGENVEFVANKTGQLFYRIHGVNLDDNSGSVTIRIRVW